MIHGRSPWRGSGAYGLWGSCRIRFRNPKGRRLLRVLKFDPQNPAHGGAKISGDPIQSV